MFQFDDPFSVFYFLFLQFFLVAEPQHTHVLLCVPYKDQVPIKGQASAHSPDRLRLGLLLHSHRLIIELEEHHSQVFQSVILQDCHQLPLVVGQTGDRTLEFLLEDLSKACSRVLSGLAKLGLRLDIEDLDEGFVEALLDHPTIDLHSAGYQEVL